MKGNKIYFKDFYGNTASINKINNQLIICNQNGGIVVNKIYNSLKGCKIALGRYGEGSFKEVKYFFWRV